MKWYPYITKKSINLHELQPTFAHAFSMFVCSLLSQIHSTAAAKMSLWAAKGFARWRWVFLLSVLHAWGYCDIIYIISLITLLIVLW